MLGSADKPTQELCDAKATSTGYRGRSRGVDCARTTTRGGAFAFRLGRLMRGVSATTQILQLLLGSDLTERSRSALLRAVQLKRATAAGLTVLHVAEPGLTGEHAKSQQAAARATMEAHLSEASAGKLRRVL